MSSGNHIVASFEQEEERKERQSKTLPCGCYKRCSCDDGDERDE